MAAKRAPNEEQFALDKAQGNIVTNDGPWEDTAFNENGEPVAANGTSLTPAIPGQSLALMGHLADEYDAFGDFRPDEIVLPITRLVQAVSRNADARHAGEFWRNVDDSYKPELLVAVLGVTRSRSLFIEGDFEAAPICTSIDAKTPDEVVKVERGDDIVMTGPTCAQCPFSQWGTARGGKGKGQECRFTYNLLILDLDDQMVSVMRIGGTSLMPFRNYMTGGKMGKRPAYAIETRLSAVQQKFESGQAYVLQIRAGEPLPTDIAEQIRASAAAYRNVSLGAAEIAEDAS